MDLIIFLVIKLLKMSVNQNDLVGKLHGSSVQYSAQYRRWCCDSVSCFVSPPPPTETEPERALVEASSDTCHCSIITPDLSW